MKKLLGFFLLASLSLAPAQDPGLSNYLGSIPVGSLRDPLGMVHTSNGRLTQPVVIIFSVPSMAQGGNQKAWAQALASDPQTKLSGKVRLFLVEDMKQAGFSDMARDEMKKEYRQGDRPILLLDETGEYFKRFGIPRNSTCILVYNRSNKLIWAEKGRATDEAVARVIQAVNPLLK